MKSTTLKELKDKKKMYFMRLIKNLKAHEMERKVREDKALPKNKIIAFKSTPTLSDDSGDFC